MGKGTRYKSKKLVKGTKVLLMTKKGQRDMDRAVGPASHGTTPSSEDPVNCRIFPTSIKVKENQ